MNEKVIAQSSRICFELNVFETTKLQQILCLYSILRLKIEIGVGAIKEYV